MTKKQDALAGVIAASKGLYEHPDEDPNQAHADPYVEEADANPERAGNGCQIYRRSS